MRPPACPQQEVARAKWRAMATRSPSVRLHNGRRTLSGSVPALGRSSSCPRAPAPHAPQGLPGVRGRQTANTRTTTARGGGGDRTPAAALLDLAKGDRCTPGAYPRAFAAPPDSPPRAPQGGGKGTGDAGAHRRGRLTETSGPAALAARLLPTPPPRPPLHARLGREPCPRPCLSGSASFERARSSTEISVPLKEHLSMHELERVPLTGIIENSASCRVEQ